MKKRLLLYLLFVFVVKTYAEDTNRAYLQCSYRYDYVFDSLTQEKRDDLMYLFIGQKKSAFYSYFTFQSDSLKNDPDHDIKWKQAFKTALQRDGGLPQNFYYRRTSNYIYKDLEKHIIMNYDDVNESKYCFEDTLDAQMWEIGDSIKTILGYSCQEAETDYHGRHWIVWFAEDIPINNGPWKLGGLPGLIMEAYDSANHHHFTINGMNRVPDIPFYDRGVDGKSKKTMRKKFLKVARDYIENSMGIAQALTGINLGLDDSSHQLHRDFLETDYR